MQPIQLRFTYTEAEYLNASRLLILGETNMLVRLGAFFVMVLFGGIALTMIGEFIFPIWAVVLLTLVVAVAGGHTMLVEMPRKYFRGNLQARGEYQLTFSNEGVWVQTSGIDSKLAWSLYTRVLENNSMYVIVYGKDARMMTAVPKRVFRNGNEELEFRNLVRQHVANRLPPSNASIEARVPEYVPSGSQPPDWR
ncbi:MAG TPA: YcxB family protein [Pyrinomonadaceae bacterium]|nr:YcxB family protein [Pyrinomonadaceae bacterium]